MKLLSLFSGIGAFEKALERERISFELVNYCEINKYASKVYSTLYNIDESINLGDITQVDINSLSDFDILVHGSPCTSFSIAGKQEGGERGTKTESSLLWYSVDIIKQKLPKIVVWENVPNVLSKRHKPVFDEYIHELCNVGYTSVYNVLDARDFGIPQSRKRMYCISILDGKFYFTGLEKICRDITISDVLEKDVDNKYYLTDEQINNIYNWKARQRPLKRVLGVNSVCPTLTARGAGEYHSGMILYSDNFEKNTDVDNFISMGALRGRYIKDEIKQKLELRKDENSNAITTVQKDNMVCNEYSIRKLTPKECWRLMGFSDDDFNKAKSLGISDAQLYRMAGNSIVVNVLQAIFKEMRNQGVI